MALQHNTVSRQTSGVRRACDVNLFSLLLCWLRLIGTHCTFSPSAWNGGAEVVAASTHMCGEPGQNTKVYLVRKFRNVKIAAGHIFVSVLYGAHGAREPRGPSNAMTTMATTTAPLEAVVRAAPICRGAGADSGRPVGHYYHRHRCQTKRAIMSGVL